MKRTRRIVLLLAAVGILHSSLVPPVSQAAGAVCRYHAFTERAWPFTRLHGVVDADAVALLSEYGIIVALAAIAYLALGAFVHDD